jgi:NADH-quinone oxidoreductase subunit N
MLAQLALLKPELIVFSGSILALMGSAFADAKKFKILLWAFLALIFMAFFFQAQNFNFTNDLLNGALLYDKLASYAKMLILFAVIFCTFLSFGILKTKHFEETKFEYLALIALSCLGMMFMVSSKNLMAFYVSLELQSLALYILIALKRDDSTATEGALKYLVLGAIGTGIILYGISLLYGVSGSFDYVTIANALNNENTKLISVISMTLLISGVAFKLSAVPFHMWTPDVYQASPTPITVFLATAPKVAAFVVLIRFLDVLFLNLTEDFLPIIVLLSGMSVVFGAIVAISQTNVKRLLAYSTIGHVGYVFLGLLAGKDGYASVLSYMTVYVFMNLGIFACLIGVKKNNQSLENLSDFAGLYKKSPFAAVLIAILVFSLAGVPPFAGFIVKLQVFMSAIKAGWVGVSVVAALASVVAAYYYLRIIKVMFFDEPNDEQKIEFEFGTKVVAIFMSGIIVFYIFNPRFFLSIAEAIF